MCGIIAIFGKGVQPSDQDAGEMLATMRHRGKDSCRIASYGCVVLGANRLAITGNLDQNQPLQYEGAAAVFNGEIYNYTKLESQFELGLVSGCSDGDVILKLWHKFGSRSFQLLDGMFGIIIFDPLRNELICARDSFGIKPLYFVDDVNSLYVSSEIKGIPERLHCDVKSVPAGSILTVSNDGYSIAKFQQENLDPPKTFRESLTEAVFNCSDTIQNFGVLLSGGLDSTIITALLSKNERKLRTISIGMQPSCSDLLAARKVARYYNTDHLEVIVQLDEILSSLKKIIWHLEVFDYFVVSNAIPQFFAFKAAAEQGVKVVLTGDGADELFLGYGYMREYPNCPIWVMHEYALQNLSRSELVRTDRMSMAHTVEARVPYLRSEPNRSANNEKSAIYHKFAVKSAKEELKEAFRDVLPEFVVSRNKTPFCSGSGFDTLLDEYSSSQIGELEFLDEQRKEWPWEIRSKSELLFFRIWSELFPGLYEMGWEKAHRNGLTRASIGPWLTAQSPKYLHRGEKQ